MHASSNEYGLCLRGEIQEISLPLLLGLLESASVTGALTIHGAETRCLLSWERGALVGLAWNDVPLQADDSREMVSAMVKQSGALFAITTGSYDFQATATPPLPLLSRGRLPLAFFIRFGLASTSQKSLTRELFSSLFPSPSHIQLAPSAQLKTLGAKAESQLAPFQEGADVHVDETPENIQQLLLSLCAVSQLIISNPSPTQRTINALRMRLQEPGVEGPLRSPFGSSEAHPEEELFTEVEGQGNSDVGLLAAQRNGFPSQLKVPEVTPPDLPLSVIEAANSTEAIPTLLGEMENWNASDLFLTQGKTPAARIHGQVIPLPLPATTPQQFDAFLSLLLNEKTRNRFRESGDLDIGYSLDSARRYRINLHRQQGHLALVARAIPSGALHFEELGLPSSLRAFAAQPRGLVLVTGATGSGKSTTLAAMIHFINEHRRAHIVTIEEPIEFVHQDRLSRITQREVGADTTSFKEALRHVVRESPDVIMIGEMRDMETMSVAISAALTGHLVFATLHTVDAVQTLQRIMSYYPDHMRDQIAMDLSISLQGIISQRLLPSRSGDRRVVALEILACTPAVAQLLRQQRIEELSDYLKHNSDPHTLSFNQSLLRLYRNGTISYEMGLAYATNPEEFALSAQGMESGVAAFKKDDPHSKTTGLDIKSLLRIVLERKASDLHLTTGRPPILRINGKLTPLPLNPLTEADLRLLLFSVLSVRQRTAYELEREIDLALSLEDGQRFRINAYHQKGKMAAAMRAIPSTIPNPTKLEIPEQVMVTADQPHGLLLVVGPTGSGKSTTLACMIDRINRTKSCRIITIEDPIEFTHTSQKSTIDQREVYADTKSFANALKYILRQDPDVVLIGEMRDQETIAAALTAAETGHLVLATLHTNDAVQTINRIIDVFPAHQQPQIRSQLASSLLGVISQRLLPRLDKVGRIAAFEIMLANAAIRNLIREDKMHQARSIIESSRGLGMITLDYSLQALYQQGKISYEAAMHYIHNPQLLTGGPSPQTSDPAPTSPTSGPSPYYK